MGLYGGFQDFLTTHQEALLHEPIAAGVHTGAYPPCIFNGAIFILFLLFSAAKKSELCMIQKIGYCTCVKVGLCSGMQMAGECQ